MCILCPIATKIAGNKLILLISNMHQFFISMCASSKMLECGESKLSNNLIGRTCHWGALEGEKKQFIWYRHLYIHDTAFTDIMISNDQHK